MKTKTLKKSLLAAAAVTVSLAIWIGTHRAEKSPPPAAAQTAQRIISLAPSVTEVLFALGLDDRIVGVTDFCKYPPAAGAKKKIGGYITPNYEAIISLRPDLIVILPEHYESKKHLAALGLTILQLDHTNADDIIRSLTLVGEKTGTLDKAEEITKDIERRLARVRRIARGQPVPKVLISFGRAKSMGSLKKAHLPSQGTLFDEAITLAGGINALQMPKVKYPLLSAEGIIRLNPDVIIDLAPGAELTGAVTAGWMSVASVNAVKNGRVHVLTNDYVTIPGPRFILMIEDLARLIHPDLDWGPRGASPL